MINRRRLLCSTGLLAAPLVARSEPGVSDTEVVFGQTAPLSGPLGSAVMLLQAGAELAFAASAQSGGVAGRRVRILSLDDEVKPERAVDNVNTLLEKHHVFGFFGCVGSGTTAATMPIARAAGAPMFGCYAVMDSVRAKAGGTAYFVRATTGREIEFLAQHLQTIGMTRIALVIHDNAGGQEAQSLAKEALEKYAIKAQVALALRDDASNLAHGARLIAEAKPQAVLVYLGGAIAGHLMKAIDVAGARPYYYGTSIVSGEAAIKAAGDRTRSLVIAQTMPFPWSRIDSTTARYHALAEAAKVPIGYYSFEGYITGQVLLEALRRCGRDLTRTKLHNVLQALKMRLAGMDIDFSVGATGSRHVEMVQVTTDGRFIH